MNNFTCDICGKQIKTKGALGSHKWRCHTQEGIDKSKNIEYLHNKETQAKRVKTLKQRYLNKEISPYMKGKHHSEESKKLISEKRKKWLQNNKQNHNWSLYKNCETIPEKEFRKILQHIKQLKTYQYYKIDESERNFELDFAIPILKIGFEINGFQHYDKKGNLEKYYQDRHDYLKSLGWEIIEIPYNVCFNEQIIKNIILNSLICNVKYVEKFCSEVVNYKLLKKQEKLTILENKKSNKIKVIEDRIILIKNSGIVFEKFGWVNKISKLIGITPQKVSIWMKKYMNEFYETKCFKRK